jgi:hypothetical protein
MCAGCAANPGRCALHAREEQWNAGGGTLRQITPSALARRHQAADGAIPASWAPGWRAGKIGQTDRAVRQLRAIRLEGL